ncbi:MAG: SGNH/GDSL hydrolase family protein [Treponema sp.]|nr:SGNH/GDSL hydrolase family protein [Treponema sp.]
MEHVYNYIRTEQDRKGFNWFYRINTGQLKAYRENAQFMFLCRSGAGILMRFFCTGDRLWFTARKINLLRLFIRVFKEVKLKGFLAMRPKKEERDTGGAAKKHRGPARLDGIDVLVDGSFAATLPRRNGRIEFSFENPQGRPREISIYFPYLFNLGVKDLQSKGTLMAAPPRPPMLCLGDSITQGFAAGSASQGYVPRLAAALGLDALNQGIAGYGFKAESLDGLDAWAGPRIITVAYGTNDWETTGDFAALDANLSAYFKRLREVFPHTPVFAMSPIWRADLHKKSANGERLERVAELIRREAARYRDVVAVEGFTLVPHDPDLFTDGYLHPNARGFEYYGDNLAAAIRSSPQWKALGIRQ